MAATKVGPRLVITYAGEMPDALKELMMKSSEISFMQLLICKTTPRGADPRTNIYFSDLRENSMPVFFQEENES
jgi:hypothetical protein